MLELLNEYCKVEVKRKAARPTVLENFLYLVNLLLRKKDFELFLECLVINLKLFEGGKYHLEVEK